MDDLYMDTIYGYTSTPELLAQLQVTIETETLFQGANLMLEALTGPYLLIAGLALGVAILAAIMRAVTTLRL